MNINIHITDAAFDSLTWDDMITIQGTKDGQVDYAALRELVLHFMVDDDKNPLPEDEARRLLGKLGMNDIKKTLDEVTDKVKYFLSQRQNDSSATSG